MGHPTLFTLCDAPDAGFLTSFPEIKSKLVRKYPPQSRAMIQGNLDHRWQNIATTNLIPIPLSQSPPIAPPNSHIPQPGPTIRTHIMYAYYIPLTGQVLTNQTGRIPIRSTSGNGDLLILYNFDSNYIHSEAMPSRT